MTDLAHLLELLYGAHTRFRSARATVRVRIHHSLLERSDWPKDAFNPSPARHEPRVYVARLWHESELKNAIPDPLDQRSGLSAVALAAGTAMFVAADVPMTRVLGIGGGSGRALATVGAALATIAVGLGISAAVQLAASVSILALAIAVNGDR
jgi:hypothetical protein